MADFDKSKHPMKGIPGKGNRFVKKGGGGEGTSEKGSKNDSESTVEIPGAKDVYEIINNYERKFGKIKQSGAVSGAQSGALDSDNPKDKERADKHAELTYERIRNINSDIPKIAQTTGHSEKEIERVKQHMFFNEYDLEDGYHRFYPDFDQAQSWDRLQSGKPLQHDLIMIKHELIESELMANGMSYDDAHVKANETENYQKALEEYKHGLDKAKKKGN